eukprot:CAMPEP_0168729208 /NCGR_PEP_ID=MMETSP0724-20121128/6080_1 /TAXON_ID=265536 /ORGANISM="Amphiprora sp., Strain CCMP467" /LENGTH=329 /DNA_ID=CAMNT_0008776075 /DNA_START=169 /DNA_END=1155 /DNA_ORIENTATION=-
MSMTSITSKYAFRPIEDEERWETVPAYGFGPFTMKRDELVDAIIAEASPTSSVHISGCRGAGKTTLLYQIGEKLQLLDSGKTLLFFETSAIFNFEQVATGVQELINSGKEVYILLDETQANPQSPVFVELLKSPRKHKITTIGAGLSSFVSSSYNFSLRYPTQTLFLSTDGEGNQPMDAQKRAAMEDAFNSGRVFTFLMQTGAVYRGDDLIVPPRAALTNRNNIGLAYDKQGRYAEALTKYQECLRIELAVLGDEHTDMVASKVNIGFLKSKKCNSGYKIPIACWWCIHDVDTLTGPVLLTLELANLSTPQRISAHFQLDLQRCNKFPA